MTKSLEEIVEESTLRKKMKEEREEQEAVKEKERRKFVRGLLRKNKKQIGILINNGESLSYILEQVNASEGSDIKKNEFIEGLDPNPMLFKWSLILALCFIVLTIFLGRQEAKSGYILFSGMLSVLFFFLMVITSPTKRGDS